MRTKVTSEAVLARQQLEQLLIDFFHEIDGNWGNGATEFFTHDCVANSGPISFSGHDGVKAYYAGRLADIRATQKDGIRTTRHIAMGVGIAVHSDTDATINFVATTFGGEGSPPVHDATLPVAISDIRFECRREADGEWRIRIFDGKPVFLSSEPFAKHSLSKK